MTAEQSGVIYMSARTYICRASPRHGDEFAQSAERSVELHRPWIYAPTTVEEFNQYLSKLGQGTAEFLLIFARDAGALAGFVTITGLTGAPYHRAILGFGAFVPLAGKGYMSDGMKLAIRFGFNELGLHRLEADVQPGNWASINLVKRLGFRREGYSPAFILIDGHWRDYERWAITKEMIDVGGSASAERRRS
jgi:[ribosomal protein S5]-alanine N-acetyltransferase